MTPINPSDHDAPLLWLVRQLHAGTILSDRVRKCRWKRKRETIAETVEQQTTNETEQT